MVGGQYILVTTASSDGGVSSLIFVKLGDWLRPNVYFVRADGWKGIKREGFWSVGGSLGIGFGEANSYQSLGKMTLESFLGVGAVLGGVSVG